MTADGWERVKEIVADALEREPAYRADFVHDACAGDTVLERQVASLLGVENRAERFLATPVLLEPEIRDAVAPIAPMFEKLGRYRIVRSIAVGGMGTVYEAEQDQPLRRVALKILRPGVTSPSMLRRFEHEWQVLAHLQHPGIAHVYDAGVHREPGTPADGVPYFAMELVPDAKTLVEYAEAEGLGVRERLELFAGVCDAVHHGHEKGVIHRDLKPANLLVDPSGRPKVIDFGVARVFDPKLLATTMKTTMGQLIGTLSYMSPEQCGGDPRDIDTRSDIYALGVVLYELIGGRLPYDLEQTPIPNAIRTIQEQPPRRLAGRSRIVDGDLETITFKALAKDPGRRYDSAAQLAADLRRYLRNEPIQARPSSVVYQVRMFTRRHKAIVGSAVVLFAALTVFAIAMTIQSGRLSRQHDQSVRIGTFLQSILAYADPTAAAPGSDRAVVGHDITMREVLDLAAARVPDELGDDPEVEAQVRWAIGKAYWQMGRMAEAEPHLERSLDLRRRQLGATDAQVVRDSIELATLMSWQVANPKAETLLRRLLGDLDDDHPQLPDVLNGLGTAATAQGDYEEANRLIRRALDLRRARHGNTHPDVADSLESLASLSWFLSDPTSSIDLTREALTIRRSFHDEDHERVLWTAAMLGSYLTLRGDPEDLDEAEVVLGDVLQRCTDNDRHETVFFAATTGLLAGAMRNMGRADEAESLYRQAIEQKRALLGDDHPEVGQTLWNYGTMLGQQQRYDDAESVLTEAQAIYRNAYGETHRYARQVTGALEDVARARQLDRSGP